MQPLGSGQAVPCIELGVSRAEIAGREGLHSALGQRPGHDFGQEDHVWDAGLSVHDNLLKEACVNGSTRVGVEWAQVFCMGVSLVCVDCHSLAPG
mmetsp:Transcript_8795/g.21978  ORF Transcript_8795/g.21978 Transcript_8795/m.21978 type:complete len:95 (-) Transcript_8795:213-497(-)